MQDENQTAADFLRRTDTLAVRLRLNVSELVSVLQMSKAMIFAYRSGQRPISSKAWRKLEAAELRAGRKKTDWNVDDSAVLREESAPDKVPGMWEVMRMIKAQVAPHVADEVERLLLEHQRERLRQEANEFFGNAEALASEAKRIGETITDKEASENLRILSDAVVKLMPTVQTLVESLTKAKP